MWGWRWVESFVTTHSYLRSSAQSLSHVWLFLTPQTVAHQDRLFMEFSRQEYWSKVPFFPPGDLPNPRTEPESPALQADSLPSELPGKPQQNKDSSNWFHIHNYMLWSQRDTLSFLPPTCHMTSSFFIGATKYNSSMFLEKEDMKDLGKHHEQLIQVSAVLIHWQPCQRNME